MFLIFYNKYESYITEIFKPKSKTLKEEVEKRRFELASRRLESTAEILGTISKSLENTLTQDDVFSSSEIYTIVDDVRVKVCETCKNYKQCWDTKKSSTYYSLFTIVGILESDVDDKDKLISSLLEECEDMDTLNVEIKNMYNKYSQEENLRKNIDENKLVLIEQIEGLSNIVKSIDTEVYQNAIFNEELEELLEKEVKDRRIDVNEIVFAQFPGNDIEIFVEFASNNTREK